MESGGGEGIWRGTWNLAEEKESGVGHGIWCGSCNLAGEIASRLAAGISVGRSHLACISSMKACCTSSLKVAGGSASTLGSQMRRSLTVESVIVREQKDSNCSVGG